MSPLFDTSELLFSEDVFTDWDGTVLATIRRPARSMFRVGELHIVDADASPLFVMPEPRGDEPDELPIFSAEAAPMVLIRKKGGLSLRGPKFDANDATGATMGTMTTNHAWSAVSARDLLGSAVADAEISGRSWTIDLSPGISAEWTVAILAMTITAAEMYYRLGDIG